MNKAKEIQHWKRILATAKTLQEVAIQNLDTATRLESEASSALELLGSHSGRRQRAKNPLTPEEELRILASLTK